jgi:hypothetical protein
MRPAGKARRPRILPISERGATQAAGMQRRPNAKLFRRHHTSEAAPQTTEHGRGAASLAQCRCAALLTCWLCPAPPGGRLERPHSRLEKLDSFARIPAVQAV